MPTTMNENARVISGCMGAHIVADVFFDYSGAAEQLVL